MISRSFSCLAFFCCLMSIVEQFFPPSIFFPKDAQLNAIEDDHFSLQLRATGEPSLWMLSKNNPKAFSFRVLWLPPQRHPLCMRVTQLDTKAILSVSQHDGGPGMRVGKVLQKSQIELKKSQWIALANQAQEIQNSSPPVETIESRGVADFDVIVVEIVRNGKYTIAVRSGFTAKQYIKKLCENMIDLSSNDSKILWNRMRGSEKTLSGYNPNPSETEDDGGSEVGP